MRMLESFGLTSADLLGSGGESQVYALGVDQILRIYKRGMLSAYVEHRHAFYADLQQQHPPFEIPQIVASGRIDEQIYTIERRMRGRDFAQVLPTLTATERQRALTSYLDVAGQIGTIQFPNHQFGELLAPSKPLQRETWPGYLWDRMQQALAESRTDVEQDVPGFALVLDGIHTELQQLNGFSERCLVHGDYFPGNVFIDADLAICGVGDFSYAAVVGDPRMDLAGAVAYLEVLDSYQPEDTMFMVQCLTNRYGAEILPILQLYRLFYSVYFSVCKHSDPRTYAWCVANLRAYGGLQT
jgi:putative membrane protein